MLHFHCITWSECYFWTLKNASTHTPHGMRDNAVRLIEIQFTCQWWRERGAKIRKDFKIESKQLLLSSKESRVHVTTPRKVRRVGVLLGQRDFQTPAAFRVNFNLEIDSFERLGASGSCVTSLLLHNVFVSQIKDYFPGKRSDCFDEEWKTDSSSFHDRITSLSTDGQDCNIKQRTLAHPPWVLACW